MPKRALIATLSLLLAACMSGQRTTIEPRRGGGVNVRQGGPGWATKRILTKQPPETVIADDGSVCRLAADRYKSSAVGSDLACDWQPGNPLPPTPVP